MGGNAGVKGGGGGGWRTSCGRPAKSRWVKQECFVAILPVTLPVVEEGRADRPQEL